MSHHSRGAQRLPRYFDIEKHHEYASCLKRVMNIGAVYPPGQGLSLTWLVLEAARTIGAGSVLLVSPITKARQRHCSAKDAMHTSTATIRARPVGLLRHHSNRQEKRT
jgi:hypothetical protein